MSIRSSRLVVWSAAVLLFIVYLLTAPANHSEAEDVYDFAQKVEQGSFTDQAGVNRLLALPMFGAAYDTVQVLGYKGRAFSLMIFLNRLLAVGCLLFFYRLMSFSTPFSKASCLMPKALLLAFSYGFWRYANEAETYMLAAFFLLAAWYSVAKGKWLLAVSCSAIGILVHLLNLIPLLLAIPLYYLLSRKWKKAIVHGVVTGLLVMLAYGICFHALDWSELGAQHHGAEAGFGFANILRGGVAFGQGLVSGNFLFGFEGFRDMLVKLFPSRMLDEEFYMAGQMSGWIKWLGCATFAAFAVCGLTLCFCHYAPASLRVWFGMRVLLRPKTALDCGDSSPLSDQPTQGEKGRDRSLIRSPVDVAPPNALCLVPSALTISVLIWFLLYAVTVMRTESGSPELWILGLIPFWLLVARFLHGRRIIILVTLLFIHNLVAGLLPVIPVRSDYHAAKGNWLVENSAADDLILTSYEPIMIFYLDYFSEAEVLNSGAVSLEELQERLGNCKGKAYAFSCFFDPLTSMKVRDPSGYGKMKMTGEALRPRFSKIVEDEFDGIYVLRDEAK